MGDNPSCIQTSSKILTIILGNRSSLLPGSRGTLPYDTLFHPQISADYSQFAVFESSEPWNPLKSYEVDWTGGLLTGPNEAGICDPVTLRIQISSAMPLYFIWDCPSCPEGSNLISALALQIGPSVLLSPEDFDGIKFYEQIVIRVQFESVHAQRFVLLHQMLKVPYPTPPLLVSAPNMVTEGQDLRITAVVRSSICEATSNSSLRFLWNQTSPDAIQYPVLNLFQWNYNNQSHFHFQVQAWWTEYPIAVTTSAISIAVLPKNYEIQLRQYSEYALVATVTEEVLWFGETPITGQSPTFVWACSMQGFVCLDADGKILQFYSEAEYLYISPNYANTGQEIPAHCLHRRIFACHSC
jgi:hypothetical protein